MDNHKHERDDPVVLARRVDTTSVGVWDSARCLVWLLRAKGNATVTMGFQSAKHPCLFIEEALYLVECNQLELLHEGVTLTFEQGYAMLSSTARQLESMRVHLVPQPSLSIAQKKFTLASSMDSYVLQHAGLYSPVESYLCYSELRKLGYIVRRPALFRPSDDFTSHNCTISWSWGPTTSTAFDQQKSSRSKRKACSSPYDVFASQSIPQSVRDNGFEPSPKVIKLDVSTSPIVLPSSSCASVPERFCISSLHIPQFDCSSTVQSDSSSDSCCCRDRFLSCTFDAFFVWSPKQVQGFRKSRPPPPESCVLVCRSNCRVNNALRSCPSPVLPYSLLSPSGISCCRRSLLPSSSARSLICPFCHCFSSPPSSSLFDSTFSFDNSNVNECRCVSSLPNPSVSLLSSSSTRLHSIFYSPPSSSRTCCWNGRPPTACLSRFLQLSQLFAPFPLRFSLVDEQTRLHFFSMEAVSLLKPQVCD
eukprot:TRINITY_DN7676_c0_g1_i1.p1 TRINITY_DN7676_c0_g1~~TRINITY_DN7676_c0_g1_i1.p1  ORF type:complete len:476 (-),score=29.88 TRINITY_DN7676_c0_g1_i1:154-1581(-)